MFGIQNSIVIGALLTVAAISTLTFASQAEEARMADKSVGLESRSIESGAVIYAENCRTCHGPQGEGVGEMGPPLNDEAFFTTRMEEVGWIGTLEEYIIATSSVGRVTATRPLYTGDGAVAMTAWSQEHGGPLRSDEIQSVADYVLNWEAVALGEYVIQPLPTPTPSLNQLADSIANGQALFEELGCSACHAVLEGANDRGAKNMTGPNLFGVGAAANERVPGQASDDYLRNAVLAPAEHIVDGYAEAGQCNAVVSEIQMQDLVNYMISLR